MMNSAKTEAKTATLLEIFSDILANLAFMFTDEDDLADPLPGETWLETTISYHGPTKGALRLWCTRSFAHQLAANLLGIDTEEEEAGDKAEDAVKEFMNILCGQLVTIWHGEQDVYNLSIPTCCELDATPVLVTGNDGDHAVLSVAGSRVHLTYTPGQPS